MWQFISSTGKAYGLQRDWWIDERRDPEWELFDLQEDPCELNSVYGDPAYSEIVSDLTRELHALQEKLGDQRHETDQE